MAHYEINGEEVELFFDGKPSENTRAEMKSIKIWWSPEKKCWHGKATPEALYLAQKLCGNRRCCYFATVGLFLREKRDDWLDFMAKSFRSFYSMPLGKPQIRAWEDCFEVLQKELKELEINSAYRDLQIIFEYALPYESGRRPDVILLSKDRVVILEFKQYDIIRSADVDQVRAYARDLLEYHYESRDKKITPVLLLTGTQTIEPQHHKGIILCSKGWIKTLLEDIFKGLVIPCNALQWMNSRYEPLPTIVDAARIFMNHGDIPDIRRVNSTVIPKAIERLTKLAKDAEENRKHILALVTGVPGAGKTYLGLKYVYDVFKQKTNDKSNTNVNSIYLSGNKALIQVLQDSLKSDVFVKNVHDIVDDFIYGRMTNFDTNIVVFDEGQRAWDGNMIEKKYKTDESEKSPSESDIMDGNMMKEKYNTDESEKSHSEPDIIVKICDSKLEWCILLILVGEGQAINSGENSGLALWYRAIRKTDHDWDIVCPEKIKKTFHLETENCLDLNQSLRTHAAGDVSNFVNCFLAGKLDEASKMASKIIESVFDMYYTRDLEIAKIYCKEKYNNQTEKKYGMIVSSKAGKFSIPQPIWKSKKRFYPDQTNRIWTAAPWFNRESTHEDSCCALRVAITEFDCQGLEIDMPIIGWGNDLKWGSSGWIPSGTTKDEKDYRINSYRVLLTRGRDGFIVFIPPTPDMDVIESVFKQAGVRKLKSNGF